MHSAAEYFIKNYPAALNCIVVLQTVVFYVCPCLRQLCKSAVCCKLMNIDAFSIFCGSKIQQNFVAV